MFILGFLIVAPIKAKAMTIDGLQAQINSLIIQITSLKSQLLAQVGGRTVTIPPNITPVGPVVVITGDSSVSFTSADVKGSFKGALPSSTQALFEYYNVMTGVSGFANATISTLLQPDGFYSIKANLSPLLSDNKYSYNALVIVNGQKSRGEKFSFYTKDITPPPADMTPVKAVTIPTPTFPPGCISASGYSSTTGLSCGCNGTVYSTYNGQLCPETPLPPPVSGKPMLKIFGSVFNDIINNFTQYNAQVGVAVANDSNSSALSSAAYVTRIRFENSNPLSGTIIPVTLYSIGTNLPPVLGSMINGVATFNFPGPSSGQSSPLQISNGAALNLILTTSKNQPLPVGFKPRFIDLKAEYHYGTWQKIPCDKIINTMPDPDKNVCQGSPN